MRASFNLAELVEYLKAKTVWHNEEMDKLEKVIVELESKTEEAYAAYERHRGAKASIKDIKAELQNMIEFPQSNPMEDPMAHSDQ